ncbi:hypothetical protein LEP1GSC083_1273 [Leptospira interrogans serovar Pyrogenes str. L0374]|uniref:Uncharacterized protein n=1 Tax=Leptospira interrogans serovar Pyrogenes str. L0374 TaxID=1049928 RepID=M6KW37_LEPIR|nr:hypothetical protein LEP1GSC083_1273 [Leptospira interrogans serovar Pyrogenes str. L0374]
MNLQLNLVGTTIKYKRIIVQSGFCTKLLFYAYHQNLNPILT